MGYTDTSAGIAYPTPVQVDSLHFDGTLNKRWCSYLLADEPDKRVLVRANGSPLWSSTGTWWMPPGPAIEIYPRHEWFNIFYGFSDDPELHRYYINIAMPAELRDGVLSYTDLDLDVGVNADFTHVVYDEDEFHDHVARWSYPDEVRKRALETLDQMVARVERRDPVFNEWQRYWHLVPRAFTDTLEGARYPQIESATGKAGKGAPLE